MNMLQSLDVEIHFWERLPPTPGRKMGDSRFIRNIGK